MTPYELAAGSLFMAKEAGLQEILGSLSKATGADPRKLQDSLVGLLAGGSLGAGIGGLTGGGKGALLGGSLGGVGGAAAGYAGSDYVRAMLEKLLNKGGDEAPGGDVAPSGPPVMSMPNSHPDLGPLTMTDYPEPNPIDLNSPAPQFLDMNGQLLGPGNGFEGELNLSGPSFDPSGPRSNGGITRGPGDFNNLPPDPFSQIQALAQAAQ